jgi:hypothetical protein
LVGVRGPREGSPAPCHQARQEWLQRTRPAQLDDVGISKQVAQERLDGGWRIRASHVEGNDSQHSPVLRALFAPHGADQGFDVFNGSFREDTVPEIEDMTAASPAADHVCGLAPNPLDRAQ